MSKSYSIIYSQGCYAGALDLRGGDGKYHAKEPWNIHCISGEAMCSPNGTVAYMSNSRYGFYGFDLNSSSQQFHRQFIVSLFDKNITQIGNTFYDSKATIAPIIPTPGSGTNIRWTYYALNLWGDPSMYIWTQMPTDIIASYPTSINFGTTQITFTTNTSNARVACLSSNGILLGRGITDNSGDVTIIFKNPLNNTNYIDVSIIGSNKNRFTGRININYSKVTGTITYNNTISTPLSNVTVRLYNENIENYYETTTNSEGSYIFNSVPSGTYNIKVFTTKSVGGINSIDAQLVLQHFSDIKKLTGLKLKAADVNNDGAVNSIDAMQITQYFVGSLPPATNTMMGKWCFDDKTIVIDKMTVNISIKGLGYGDVDGSYRPN